MGKHPQKDPIHRESSHAAAGKYMGVGLQFAGAIALFLFAGMWLDERFGLGPWGMVAGVLIGASAGFYSIYTRLMTDQREQDRTRRERKERDPR